MALTAGALSQVSVSSNSCVLASAAASGGVGPYTYQWYQSTSSGFSPGAGSLVSGATNLTQSFSGLIPNTALYFKVVVTDTGNGNATVTSAQLAVTTAATTLNPNVFAQSPVVGQIDLRYNYNTVSCLVDLSQVGNLYAGMAVKVVDSADGVPKVVGCAANSDNVFGFINFDIKTIAFVAGSPCEISQAGNVIYLYATGAIARSAQVQLDLSASAAVAQIVPSSGANVVGYAFDHAAGFGSIIRVKVSAPSFQSA